MSFSGWREVKLGDVCTYASAKVSVSEVSEDNYISTENMLPNKSGVTKSSGLPTVGSVTKYSAGNVLVSNIRPYFRKIWYADRDGGCSNDVLVFDINDSKALDSKFLFYCLSNDVFFDYVMAGSKGTKMPRGDKGAIMKYPVPLPPLPEQKAIAATLSALDDMIDLNNRINKTLEEIAQAIFKSWFVDFEPFKDGEFEESELGLIPKGWRVGRLGDIVDIFDSKRVPLSSRQRSVMEKKYPYYGAATLMDYVDNYIFEGVHVLLGEDGTVMDEKGYPILQYVWGKFWVNNHAHVLKGKGIFSDEFLYMLLKNTNVASIVTGAVQLKINQGNLTGLKVIIPPDDVVKQYNEMVKDIFACWRSNVDEKTVLISLRDTLLPKLMSGEIRVPIGN